ncbi:RNA ligase/cyclic nucleotide phosphodiesterase [Clohesyomyces aquaticus]|uniref:RNA ligase/cyclic nucleotide phosphodiesterase n=1 Tax=Clohesyomyces aquaticus TaxID=1231657 RepID=A0A1Y1Y1X8_9PLEO|nr:RNA ligase/cyclic nucleotide phosphodiesterase [Clohesyomyces aquaticus]
MSQTLKPKYPLGVPSKFSRQGKTQPFPGNTLICHLFPETPLYKALLSLHAILAESELSHLYTLLPPSSYHMTVLEGICDQNRQKEYWFKDLPLDAGLADADAFLRERLNGFKLNPDFKSGDGGDSDGELDLRPPYKLRVKGFDPLVIGIGIHIEPQTAEENKRIRSLRDRLSETLGMRFPGHEHYGLHLSVAYLIRHLDNGQRVELERLLGQWEGALGESERDFELGGVEVCRFGGMERFEKIFVLGE